MNNGELFTASATNSLPNHCFFGESSDSPSGAITAETIQYYSMIRRWNLPVDQTAKYQFDFPEGNNGGEEFF